MTGMETAAETAAVSSQSNPRFVPSRSDRRQQDLAGAPVGRLPCPFDRVALGRLPSAAHVDPECAALPLGVDGDDHRLTAVAPGEGGQQRRARDGGGVQADLVGARLDGGVRMRLVPDPAADAERQEDLLRHRVNRSGHRLPLLDGRGDVEDHHLVDPLAVVAPGERRRIAGRAQCFEVDPLDDRAVADVETRDDAFGEHQAAIRSRTFFKRRSPTSPDFSG